VILSATVRGESHRLEVRHSNGGYTVLIDGRQLEVGCLETGPDSLSLLVDGKSHDVLIERRPNGYSVGLGSGNLDVALAARTQAGPSHKERAKGAFRLEAPMPGKVVRILVEPGQAVVASQSLVVIEAMKMENELRAPRGGTVRLVHVREGQAVEAGAPLVAVD